MRSIAAQRDEAKRAALSTCFIPMRLVQMLLPVDIGAFTDFFCSLDHTLRMGRTVPPKAFKYLPIAYHGRATSIVASGTKIVRPNGAFERDKEVTFGPEPALDFELELGAFVGSGNAQGTPVPLSDAEDQIFGHCLVNDWSARGMQLFESSPLGPFLGKSFATSISPWIVTAEALLPYRVPSPIRDVGDPEPPQLTTAANSAGGAIDLELQAFLLTPQMRADGRAPVPLATTAFRDMNWTFAQMLAHHTSNGCNLRTGDLLVSGTTSGPTDASRACLAEITARGTQPLQLPNGEVARMARRRRRRDPARTHHPPDYARIGFGECQDAESPPAPHMSSRAKSRSAYNTRQLRRPFDEVRVTPGADGGRIVSATQLGTVGRHTLGT